MQSVFVAQGEPNVDAVLLPELDPLAPPLLDPDPLPLDPPELPEALLEPEDPPPELDEGGVPGDVCPVCPLGRW